ncbi:MAG: ORF6N domain-containing protein [Clostridium sp.]|uniref:ORF6N domain-containing protein n=1 Tax=Clostridium sp. TaxID=1506 RepID=UPI0029088486|nr:ORF6N domain-containing protein [Clostridium sp.]MDU5211115.1 ORF6N domain-containing protein [Clostridium sp.]MDU6762242.1 ORF6N domain-containing protein [Clostridium sp.]
MNKQIVKINGLKEIDGMKFHDIEGGFGECKKAILVKEIANIHARQESHINELINNNIKRFKDGVDIINLLSSEDFKIVVDDLGLRTSNRQKYSYLLSERGYSKLLKILEDDVAWEQYEKLVDGYFNMRQALNTSELSPELQMFNQMFKAMANNELEAKEAKRIALNANNKAEEVKEEIQSMRDVITLDSNGWRKETATLINKIANKLGGFEHIRNVREESYKLLNETYGVDINRRLKNKQKNMALEGVSRSKINKVNLLDVIAEDKKLLNGYISIVTKMAIRHGVA